MTSPGTEVLGSGGRRGAEDSSIGLLFFFFLSSAMVLHRRVSHSSGSLDGGGLQELLSGAMQAMLSLNPYDD